MCTLKWRSVHLCHSHTLFHDLWLILRLNRLISAFFCLWRPGLYPVSTTEGWALFVRRNSIFSACQDTSHLLPSSVVFLPPGPSYVIVVVLVVRHNEPEALRSHSTLFLRPFSSSRLLCSGPSSLLLSPSPKLLSAFPLLSPKIAVWHALLRWFLSENRTIKTSVVSCSRCVYACAGACGTYKKDFKVYKCMCHVQVKCPWYV